MITKLSIESSPIFGNLELRFKEGFCVFSGASGSGKSVLMESLLSCFGLREPNAPSIETDLLLSPKFLEELGLEGELLNIKIVKKDKTRYFVNFAPIAKKTLSDLLGRHIKHIHSRGGDELEGGSLVGLLDSFCVKSTPKHTQDLERLKSEFAMLKEAKSALKELEAKESHTAQLKEIAEFEINKIASLNPKEGEYENLLILKKTLSHKEKIKEAISKASVAFGYTSEILSALNALNIASEQDTQQNEANSASQNEVEEIHTRLSQALNDAQSVLEREQSRLDELDELDSEAMLHRISSLSELIHRYGGINNALATLESKKAELETLQNFDAHKKELQSKIATLESSLKNLCGELNKNRAKALPDLESSLKNLCGELKLPSPSIKLIQKELESNGDLGVDLRLANSGIDTLSAGEFNRLRLAIMCLGARLNKAQGVLILDEIDANLSGEESEGVAKVLKELSKSYQVFAISHQMNMPSLADAHFLVAKNNVDSMDSGDSIDSKKAKSSITLLNYDGRVRELARMVSGANITNEAIEFAKTRLSEYVKGGENLPN
ncbi:AAA family ATPase [Helicobacter sp. T3_23-1056]